jgi:hypothetical protein
MITTTLAGFLLVVGTAMFVVGLLEGRVRVEELELQTPDGGGRPILRILGALFVLVAASMYWASLNHGNKFDELIDRRLAYPVVRQGE